MSTAALHLACADRLELLRTRYEAGRRIQIREVLEPASADAIYACLARQKEWNLVYLHDGRHVDSNATAVARWPVAKRRTLEKIVFAEARNRFQYYYANIPVYDLYHRQQLPESFFGELFEFLNGSEFLDTIRGVTGDAQIAFADAQATRFDPGHFLTCHDDAIAGRNRDKTGILYKTLARHCCRHSR